MTLARRCTAALIALVLAVQLALPACAPAARPGFGFGFPGKKGSIVTEVPPVLSAITYDTSIGNGVDANGRADLPLRAGAKRFYVNNSTGSDSNSCTAAQSPSTPKATPKSAILCVTDAEGDQVLIAQGTSYASGIYNIGPYGGFSAVYPLVIESYDPADPTNEAKLGAATSANRPVLTVPGTDMPGAFISGVGKSYRAVRGLKFDGGGVAGVQMLIGVSAGSGNHYTLIENDDFASVQLSIQGSNTAFATLNQHFVIRSSTFHGEWATDGHGQGAYLGELDGFTLEDSVFIHAGWKDGAAKTDPANIGGPSIFGHEVYSQVTSINGIFRRNYFGQSPDDAGELKGGGIYQRNLAIGDPIGGWFGDGDQYSEYRPFGVYADGGYNAILSGGWCYQTKDVNTVGLIHHNVCARADTSLSGTQGLMADDGQDLSPNAVSLPTYPTFDHNILYSWAASGNDKSIHTSSGTGLLADIHATYSNNLWGDPTSGSNTNNGATTFANSYTGDTLAQALGYANLAAAEAAWKADPQLHGWRNGVSLVLTGYGLIDPGLVDLTTNAAVTLGNPIDGQFIGTHDGSTLSFSGLPTGVTGDTSCRCWRYDGSGTAGSGTFSVTETPPTGPPHTSTIAWSKSASPVLSGLTITPGNASASVAISTNTGSGKLFYGYSTVSGSPIWSQLRSGVNADDSFVLSSFPITSSQAVSASGAQPTINLSTSLTNGTTYYFSVAQLDGNNNPSITSTATFVPVASWTPSSFGSNLVLDLTKLDSSHLFTNTGCTTPVTTDGQTAKCIKDASSSAYVFTNATGWVYHANSGKPYLTMDASTAFISTATITYADANGLTAVWVAANLSLSGLNDLVDTTGARMLLAATQVPNTVMNVYNSSTVQLAQDPLGNSPLNTYAVFSGLILGTSGSGTVESFVNNVGDGSTAWTGTPQTSSIISIGNPAGGRFYGGLMAKGDQSANKANAQTFMNNLGP